MEPQQLLSMQGSEASADDLCVVCRHSRWRHRVDGQGSSVCTEYVNCECEGKFSEPPNLAAARLEQGLDGLVHMVDFIDRQLDSLRVQVALLGQNFAQAMAVEQTRKAKVADECRCVFSCADDPATMCSLSGTNHVHPDTGNGTFGACSVHPDAPGDL